MAKAVQWIEVHELLAECLALSEQIEQALELYGKVLDLVVEPLKKAELYGKIAQYNMALYRYSTSLQNGIKGLSIVNTKFTNSEISAIIYIFVN